MKRIAQRYWRELPWEGRLGNDDVFRLLKPRDVVEESELGEGPLDDLAILVLFSVFEAQVRQFVYDQIRAEASRLTHPTLVHAANETLQKVEEGSFFRVLEPYKPADANLVEEVNQVRRYRNWVAHGRRGKPAVALVPREAFERLNRFLDVIGLAEPGS
jgi:hypothetical protein